MKYGLEITQRTEDGENVIAVDAHGEIESDGAYLKYAFDGASYELAVCEGHLMQKRTGEINLFMLFEGGKTTMCKIGEGQTAGTFSIYTHTLNVTFGEYSFNVQCSYSDGNGGDVTHLWLKAYLIEE